MENQWISTAEAAAIMGVSDSFVRRLARERQIEHIKIGSYYAISKAAAEAYIRKRGIPKNQGNS